MGRGDERGVRACSGGRVGTGGSIYIRRVGFDPVVGTFSKGSGVDLHLVVIVDSDRDGVGGASTAAVPVRGYQLETIEATKAYCGGLRHGGRVDGTAGRQRDLVCGICSAWE